MQNALCKATVTHSKLQSLIQSAIGQTRAQRVCSEEENSAVVAVAKHLGLISS